MCLKFSALPVFCHLQDKAELMQQASSMARQMDEAEKWCAPGGSSNSGSDTQELSVQLQQVKEQLAESQRNAQTWMNASLQCQTELDESAEQAEDAQQHVQILQGRLDQEERRWPSSLTASPSPLSAWSVSPPPCIILADLCSSQRKTFSCVLDSNTYDKAVGCIFQGSHSPASRCRANGCMLCGQ